MSPRRAAVLTVLLSFSALAQDGGLPLIPRDILLGNPERTGPQLSPDGKRLAWLAPDEKNVMQVWVKTLGQTDEAIVTADKRRGIRAYWWTRDSTGLLYGQDADGDENFHVFHVDLTTKNVRDLTPWQGVRASLLDMHPKFPDVVLVTMNVRDRKLMDVWRVNLKTGAAELDTQNPGDVVGWTVDPQFVVRGATATLKGGGTELRTRESAKAKWTPLVTVGLEENVGLEGFTEDGRSVFLTTSINSDTERLVEKSLKTGAERLLAQSPASDVMGQLAHPVKHVMRAAGFDVNGRLGWTAIDSSVKGDLEGLDQALAGDFFVVSMDDADARWLVAERLDAGSTRFWTWDRKAKKAELLFSAQPKLDGLPLATMTPVSIPARDGLTLPGYLSLPPGKAKPVPMVLLVHGGPWGRDTWGYNGTVQLLTNRGYAVLQVNFRSSSGYGKRFLNAGNRQWGLAMHDDLLDAVSWAVKEGVTTPKQVAIMGGSYGGYATLAGLAFTPDVFACGVDIVGPSNLFTLLSTIPPYWTSMKSMLVARMGDPEKAQDKELLTKASPLFSAQKIKKPLLIGQGANDPRVKVAESEQIVAAMEKNGLPVTYVVYPDEGHGFARPENRTDFMARAEGFLAKCLGGRVEPLPKDGKVAGSTAAVKVVGAKK
ncbi:MAG: S9 family peptidase [Myxococcales bacterium]|nr:S9 family peptidase [Myxococcales bacterium]